MTREVTPRNAAKSPHVHEWVDKALLHEPSLKVCACGATLTDREYRNSDAALSRDPLRVAYADPPYPGMSHFYKDHPDYDGEVDHAQLLRDLAGYDGWCLHTASTTLIEVVRGYEGPLDDVRVMAWVKPFASWKKHVAVAYAWEPVLVKPARPRPFDGYTTMRDWLAESITLKKGLTGVKPENVCRWLFDAMGCEPDDELVDLFPGSGAVTNAWLAFRSQGRLVA